MERWRCAATGSGMDKDSKGQRKLEGAVWTRTAKDRESWRTLTEGDLLQWKDTA